MIEGHRIEVGEERHGNKFANSCEKTIKYLRKCYVCKIYIPAKQVKEHVEIHREGLRNLKAGTSICETCNKRFRGQYELDEHIKVSHGNVVYSCDSCCKTYRTKCGLAKHNRRIHKGNQHDSPRDVDDAIDFVATMHKCTTCDTVFTFRSNLMRHVKKKSCHLHTGKLYFCDCCRKNGIDKRFKYKRYFNEHQKSLHSANRYQCEYCKQTFCTRSGLAYHKKKHHQLLIGKPNSKHASEAK